MTPVNDIKEEEEDPESELKDKRIKTEEKQDKVQKSHNQLFGNCMKDDEDMEEDEKVQIINNMVNHEENSEFSFNGA